MVDLHSQVATIQVFFKNLITMVVWKEWIHIFPIFLSKDKPIQSTLSSLLPSVDHNCSQGMAVFNEKYKGPTDSLRIKCHNHEEDDHDDKGLGRYYYY